MRASREVIGRAFNLSMVEVLVCTTNSRRYQFLLTIPALPRRTSASISSGERRSALSLGAAMIARILVSTCQTA
jgi:hypothetical protein